MNRREAGNLALRKELLLARSSLCRLKIRFQAHDLRQSLTWRRVGASVASSTSGREALFLLVAEGLGRYRVARWLSFAARALAVAKMTSLAIDLLRKPVAQPQEGADARSP